MEIHILEGYIQNLNNHQNCIRCQNKFNEIFPTESHKLILFIFIGENIFQTFFNVKKVLNIVNKIMRSLEELLVNICERK